MPTGPDCNMATSNIGLMVELVDVIISVVPLLSVVLVLGGMVVLGMFGLFGLFGLLVEGDKVVPRFVHIFSCSLLSLCLCPGSNRLGWRRLSLGTFQS